MFGLKSITLEFWHLLVTKTKAIIARMFQPAQGESYTTESANLIKFWLGQCKREHSDEWEHPRTSISPARLIKLDKNPGTQRLVAVDTNSELPEYVALSYSWGTDPNLKTETTETLEEFEKAIPEKRLPRTLKDVFHFARLLGFQYVWVDALCIIQDGKDWEQESAKMGDIYANATLVIAAMASPGVDEGLFMETTDQSKQQEEMDDFHEVMRTCRTLSEKEWKDPNRLKKDYPLLTRGWAFQERLLARRIVHFTKFELLWECATDRWCRCGDKEKTKNLSGKINNLNSAIKIARQSSNPLDKRLMWRECVKSFSKRDLAELSDRPHAIAGIASYLGHPSVGASTSRYIHGMWEDSLPWDLLWYCDQSFRLGEKKDRNPSFSWFSVDCGIEWPTCREWTLKDKYSEAISTGTCFEFHPERIMAKPNSFICEATIIGNQRLKVTSKKTPVLIQQTNEQHRPAKSSGWTITKTNLSSETLPFFPDIVLDNPVSKEGIYYYLEIAAVEDDSRVRQAGLVIKLKDKEASQEQGELYERVGFAGDISCGTETAYRFSDSEGEVCTLVLV